MSLKSAPYYWVECDGCGLKSTDGDDYSAYNDEDGARAMATGSLWVTTEDGRDLCDDCSWKLVRENHEVTR